MDAETKQEVTEQALADEPVPLAAQVPVPPPPMEVRLRAPGRFFFAYGVCKHLIWAILLASAGEVVLVTPIGMMLKVFKGADNLAIALILSSLVAIIGLFQRSTLTRVFCLMPQQTLMAMTFMSCLTAIMTGRLPNGAERPWMLLAASQTPAMLAAMFHTIALILLARRV